MKPDSMLVYLILQQHSYTDALCTLLCFELLCWHAQPCVAARAVLAYMLYFLSHIELISFIICLRFRLTTKYVSRLSRQNSTKAACSPCSCERNVPLTWSWKGFEKRRRQPTGGHRKRCAMIYSLWKTVLENGLGRLSPH